MNRQRLVLAARDAVAEVGLQVSVRDIADRAGVGLSTLYRHFDGKQSVIDGLSVYRWMQAYSTIRRNGGEETPLCGVVAALALFARTVSTDAAFIHAAEITVGRTPYAIVPVRKRFDPVFTQLWSSAQRRGEIRPGIDAWDAMDLAWAIRDRERWGSKLGILLDGMLAEPGRATLTTWRSQTGRARPR